jgi:hypothetical protein
MGVKNHWRGGLQFSFGLFLSLSQPSQFISSPSLALRLITLPFEFNLLFKHFVCRCLMLPNQLLVMSIIQIPLAKLPLQVRDKVWGNDLLFNHRGLLRLFRQLRDQFVLRVSFNWLGFWVDYCNWKGLFLDSSYCDFMNKGLQLLPGWITFHLLSIRRQLLILLNLIKFLSWLLTCGLRSCLNPVRSRLNFWN